MAKSKNKNQKQTNAKRKKLLQSISQTLPTKGNLKNTSIETGKDLVVGVLGGGFMGAAIGKPSLLIGLISTGAGHFLDNRLLVSFGMGMMASNGFQNNSTLKGLEGIDGVKERLQNYKGNFLQKMYIEDLKALANKNTSSKNKATNGLEDVQYFTYPPTNYLEGNDDLLNLHHIEQQIQNMGMQQDVQGVAIFQEPDVDVDTMLL